MNDLQTLPTPRTLLTSLINTLASTPPNPQSQLTSTTSNVNDHFLAAGKGGPPTNPLKSLPPSHRALLTTLHVLFPPGMLLQSLDLLDRGLVTRVIEEDPLVPSPAETQHQNQEQEQNTPQAQQQQEPAVFPPQANTHLPPSDPPNPEPEKDPQKKDKNSIYQVRSSQTPKSRFSTSTSTSGAGTQVYSVHLQAWNCSCAAFAFSAFPSSLSSSKPWLSGPEEDMDFLSGKGEGEEEGGWEFGGLSNDGRDRDGGVGGGGGMPVCKHLLACVLVERWGDVLGGFVKKRVVGREEMAGLGAE